MLKKLVVTSLTCAAILGGSHLYAQGGVEVSVGGLAGTVTAGTVFADTSGHWAKESIEIAVQKGYVDGYDDGTFKPDRHVSRGEFVKMAVTAMKLPISGKTDGPEWYLPYVDAAVDAALHHPSDFVSGDWSTPITREEMARMIVRATDEELRKEGEQADVKRMVYEATKKGLLQGLDRGELGLEQSTTRAQSVTVIERILTVNSGGSLEVDNYAVNRAGVYAIKTNMFDVWPEAFGKLHPGSPKWDPDNLFIETPDGKYRGELDAFVLIDLDDPNDPHWDLLPDVSKMTWANRYAGKYYPLKDMSNCYLVVALGKTIFNKDSEIYSDLVGLPVSFHGFTLDRGAMRNGELKGLSGLAVDDKHIPSAWIISKKAETGGHVSISLISPAIPPNKSYDKQLLWVTPPNKLE